MINLLLKNNVEFRRFFSDGDRVTVINQGKLPRIILTPKGRQPQPRSGKYNKFLTRKRNAPRVIDLSAGGSEVHARAKET
ncbi:MAG TPA: hypothetical protein VKT76_08270 [Bradyrhizobium sp.]|nr:hypothetical protein [Bradyrhizobium sp.]